MPDFIRKLFVRIMFHDGFRRYGTNTIWLVAEKFIRLIFGFLVGIYVAKRLEPENYGLYNYVISFAALLAVFTSFGLESLLGRELVRHPDRQSELLGSAAFLRLCGVLVMPLLVILIAMFNPKVESTRLLLLVIISGYGFQVFQVFESWFQASVLGKYVALSQILALIAVSLCRLYLAWALLPLWCFLAAEAAYMGLCVLGYGIFYRRCGGRITAWRIHAGTCFRLLSESWPYWIGGVAVLVYMRIDQVMIGSMIGDAANGYYSVAVRLAEIFYFIPSVVCASFLPALMRARDVSEQWFRNRLEYLFGIMFYFSLLLIGACWAMSFLIPPLYGEAYREAVPLLRFYSVTLWFVCTGAPLSLWYLVENRQRLAAGLAILGAVFNVAFNLVLIRCYGTYGAVVATLASYALCYCCCLLLPSTRAVALLRLTAPFTCLQTLRNNTPT